MASKDQSACIKDTVYLCTTLVEKGHSTSPSKLQLCQKEVKYLGLILREGQQVIDPEKIEAIIELLQETITRVSPNCGILSTVDFWAE